MNDKMINNKHFKKEALGLSTLSTIITGVVITTIISVAGISFLETIDIKNELKRKEAKGLIKKVLKKAEMKDGEFGLSFEEQAQLAKDLDYGGVVPEGNNGFELYVGVNPSIRFWEGSKFKYYLDVNDKSTEVSKQTLQDYLNQK